MTWMLQTPFVCHLLLELTGVSPSVSVCVSVPKWRQCPCQRGKDQQSWAPERQQHWSSAELSKAKAFHNMEHRDNRKVNGQTTAKNYYNPPPHTHTHPVLSYPHPALVHLICRAHSSGFFGECKDNSRPLTENAEFSAQWSSPTSTNTNTEWKQ